MPRMTRATDALFAMCLALPVAAPAGDRLSSTDLFDLHYASDVEIAPDGERVVYVRAIHDIMSDSVLSNLWGVDAGGGNHRPLLSGRASYSSPRFSPSGDRLAYVAEDGNGKTQLFVRWMDTGATAVVTNLVEAPSSIEWSPDGGRIASTMRVPAEKPLLAELPKKPEGAEWAPAPVVIDSVVYRFDGKGYLDPGFEHVFVVPADGGAARQLTSGDFNHEGPLSWMPDGSGVVFSANRTKNRQYERDERDLYRVDVESGAIERLTELPGIEGAPAVSPDGKRIVFERNDHQGRQYSVTTLGLINADGGNPRILGEQLDRQMARPSWSRDGRRVYFSYDDRGERKVAAVDLDGGITTLVERISGTTIGRPYLSGDFSVAGNGSIAFMAGTAQRPADVHVRPRRGDARRLTDLNASLLGQRAMAEVHEIVYESSVDGTEIQGWYLTPPDFDSSRKYPLILEIHGGPHAAYGPHFSAEMQRYAADGYVVFYDNHRGSSSYGRQFGLKLEYKYASEDDFGDHMSGVDGMIEKGFVDPERLFVTGGSAGGIAAAYAIGLTDRFRAAAVAKPVINWISKTLTGDIYTTQIEHQFPGPPWEEIEHYWKRSPLSLVGNVTTPTLLMTGEDDFRTPISETEQYYQALKLRKVETVMVRLPGTSHGIAEKPSRLIAKIDNILAWFERHDTAEK